MTIVYLCSLPLSIFLSQFHIFVPYRYVFVLFSHSLIHFIHIRSTFLFILSHAPFLYSYSHWVVVYSPRTKKIDSMLGKRLSVLPKTCFYYLFSIFIAVIWHFGKHIIIVTFIALIFVFYVELQVMKESSNELHLKTSNRLIRLCNTIIYW